MKKTFLILGAVMSSVALNAQIEFGPKIGLNLSNQSWSEGSSELYGDDQKSPFELEGYSQQMLPGIQIGGVVSIGVTESFSIRPELLFSQKGNVIKVDGFGTSTTRLNYLDIPINLSYSFPIGENKIDLFTGPYLSIGLGGKMEFESAIESVENSSVSLKAKTDPGTIGDEDQYYNPLDFGLNFGAGFKVNKLYFSANYNLGMGNVAAQSDEYPEGFDYGDYQKFRNNVLTVGVSYLFGGE